MRITSNTFSNNLLSRLQQLQTKQTSLQNQASTGLNFQTVSENPSSMQRVLNFLDEGNTLQQYQTNIDQLQNRATVSNDSMKQLKSLADRASEIATLADGTEGTSDLKNYASEVTQIIQQAVELANTKYNGQYVFGGTKNSSAPYAATTDANGLVSGVAYSGNSDVAGSQIDDGVTVSAQPPGENTDGTGAYGLITDSRTGADFFNHLISLQNHLQSGDTTAISGTDISHLADDADNFVFQLATNGAVQGRLDVASSLVNSRITSTQSNVSDEADADITDILVRFNQTQTAYEAALQSGAATLNKSLLDYLH